MSLLQESYLRNLAAKKVRSDSRYSYESHIQDSIQKSLLLESSVNFSAGQRDFDIFLSHSFSDKELVLGFKLELESFGYSVYVDWVDDAGLDRTNVTSSNVLLIQQRMAACKCLLYATSSSSSNSRWMPWETGYMDGLKNKVAIIPAVEGVQNSFRGVEYLSIYPFIEKEKMQDTSRSYLWVVDQSDNHYYSEFNGWLSGGSLNRHN